MDTPREAAEKAVSVTDVEMQVGWKTWRPGIHVFGRWLTSHGEGMSELERNIRSAGDDIRRALERFIEERDAAVRADERRLMAETKND